MNILDPLIHGSWLERVLFGMLYLILISAIVGLGLLITDASITISYEGAGAVSCKEYHAPYTTFIWTGKVMVPQYHPARYVLCVKTIKHLVTGNINHSVWSQYEIGDEVYINYRVGIFKGTYLDGIVPNDNQY